MGFNAHASLVTCSICSDHDQQREESCLVGALKCHLSLSLSLSTYHFTVLEVPLTRTGELIQEQDEGQQQ